VSSRIVLRRIAKLEDHFALSFPQRVVVLYEGKELEQSDNHIGENTLVVRVEYVEAPLPDVDTENAR